MSCLSDKGDPTPGSFALTNRVRSIGSSLMEVSVMKRVFSVGLMAGLMALGVQSKAEAVVTLSVTVCQGLTCTNRRDDRI